MPLSQILGAAVEKIKPSVPPDAQVYGSCLDYASAISPTAAKKARPAPGQTEL